MKAGSAEVAAPSASATSTSGPPWKRDKRPRPRLAMRSPKSVAWFLALKSLSVVTFSDHVAVMFRVNFRIFFEISLRARVSCSTRLSTKLFNCCSLLFFMSLKRPPYEDIWVAVSSWGS